MIAYDDLYGTGSGTAVRCVGMAIRNRREGIALYREPHAQPWPVMEAALSAADIRNRSIFLRKPENLLFGCWESAGADSENDLRSPDELAVAKKWRAPTAPCRERLKSVPENEWWSTMPEVCHLD